MTRTQWDERAQADPLHYIASWREGWTDEDFFASGERDYEELIEPVLQSLGMSPSTLTAADIGCGVGRITLAFARRFRKVLGVDISPEMLRRAAKYGKGVDNVEWLLNSGEDLSSISSACVDFAFSYLMLQHVPDLQIAYKLVSEIIRITRIGGGFMFQFNSRRAPTMNIRGRVLWGIIDRLRGGGPESLGDQAARWLARLARMDPLKGGLSWRGAILEPRQVLDIVWAQGGIARIDGWGTQMTWCWGLRARRADAGRGYMRLT